MISSSSLFHFTAEFDSLSSILTGKKFVPFYCLETISNFNDSEIYFPMVCFCDIRLHQIKNHVETYGKYGIAMSKEWGIERRINPIHYLTENAIQNSFVSDQLTRGTDREKESALITIATSKPYKGKMFRFRLGGYIENIIFYDEREWRYFPAFNETNKFPLAINNSVNLDYDKEVKKFNDKISKSKLCADFSMKDVKYILVPEKEDKYKLLKCFPELNVYVWSEIEDDL